MSYRHILPVFFAFLLTSPPVFGATMAGRITDATTGQGLHLRMDAWLENGQQYVTNTAADGSYRFSNLPPGRYRVRPANDTYVVTRWPSVGCGGPCVRDATALVDVPTAGSDVREMDFTVERGGTIVVSARSAGVVVPGAISIFDETGALVPPTATISERAGRWAGRYYAVWEPTVDSPFLFEHQVHGRPGCPACLPLDGTPIEVALGKTTTVVIELQAAPTIRGFVTDAMTGAPVAGASVALHGLDGTFVPRTTTSADGAYAVASDAAKVLVNVVVEAQGYLRAAGGVECLRCFGSRDNAFHTADRRHIQHIQLVRGTTVSGRVLDEWTLDPIPNSLIEVRNEVDELVAITTTGPDGRYTTAAVVGRSRYEVTAWRDEPNVRTGKRVLTSSADGRPVTGVDVKIPPSQNLRRFRITENGSPVEGAMIEFWSLDGRLVRRSPQVTRADGSLETGLRTGTFYVRTANRSGFVDALLDGRPCGYGCRLGGAPLAFEVSILAPTVPPTPFELGVYRIAINDLLPRRGSVEGGEWISIMGGGFVAGTRVEIGGVPASIVRLDHNEIRVVTPPHTRAVVDLTVIRPDGLRATQLFEYAPPCTRPELRLVQLPEGDDKRLRVEATQPVGEIEWLRGTRGPNPMALIGRGREIVVAVTEAAVEYTARVPFDCGEDELRVRVGGKTRRRPTR